MKIVSFWRGDLSDTRAFFGVSKVNILRVWKDLMGAITDANFDILCDLINLIGHTVVRVC